MFRATASTDGDKIEGRRVGSSGVTCIRIYSELGSISEELELVITPTAMVEDKLVGPLATGNQLLCHIQS